MKVNNEVMHAKNKQPEALRLAALLEENFFTGKQGPEVWHKAAAELRRLHAANLDCVAWYEAIKSERDELLKALSDIAAYYPNSWAADRAEAAITKAGETK